jgi:alkanesulfonate monooxygenase SsuD/methylene tetrahydromethanopterin reductase-like flavin-dependent oxidoreductase (luciferase family)
MKGLWTQERFEYQGEFFTIPPVLCRPAPARKPHPPLLLGGFNEKVLQRAGEWGDGWYPAYLGNDMLASGPDNVREGRRKMEQYANDAGRDNMTFQVAAILVGEVTKDVVRTFEDAGTDRVAIMLPEVASFEEARAAMEKIADEVL